MKEPRPEFYEYLIEYLSNPADQRTWKEFSLSCGVSVDTIEKFRNSHALMIESDVSTVRARYIGAIRTAALKSLFNRINKSDAALKMALTITGDLVERTENITSILTPEEKREKVAQLLERLSERKQKE